MKTPCKVCVSEHRAEIEQKAEAGEPLRDISEFMLVKYGEHMSHTAIGTHLSKHRTKATEKALLLAESNAKRIRNLEINAYLNRPSGTDWSVAVYNINGQTSHTVQREDTLLRAIPDSELLGQEHKDIVTTLRNEIKAEYADSLDRSLWDEARTVRAEWAEEDRIKAAEDAEAAAIAAAKQEILEREKERNQLSKNIEASAKKLERRERLQALRDKELEERAGIDENGDPLVCT